jgi:(1->4)-alpha-D-glucan 1-alpha-D-glucosylmutase
METDRLKIRAAIGEFLVACPVYKVYNAPSNFMEENVKMVKLIGERAMKKNPDNKETIKMLTELFLLKLPGSRNDYQQVDAFFRRCMQFAGPLMAKGIEDTAFYSYNAFIGHNEVGDSPGYFGIGADKFHRAMEERLKTMPLSMNTLSTHDTKRGEDARARLSVLSDMPVKWMDEARKWRELNRSYKKQIEDREIPAPNDEYLIYQVLCAHLPMNAQADEAFIDRLRNTL